MQPDQSAINTSVVRTIAALVGAILFGLLADAVITQRRARLKPEQRENDDERTSRWNLALLVASYALLVPGLHLTTFSFSITMNVMGYDRVIVSAQDTTFEVVDRLYDRGAPLGAAFICFYAVVVPALKLALLILGKLGLRCPAGSRYVHWGRCCIVCVQSISKWASPDVFAYVLLIYMFRSMDNQPRLVTTGQLEAGFTCFCFFCVGSTLSSLWIHVPGYEDERNAESTTGSLSVASHSVLCRLLRLRRQSHPKQVRPGVFFFGWVWMIVLFTGFFVAGLVTPCLRLEFDVETLHKHNDCLTPFVGVLKSLGLEELMRAEVSVYQCMKMLLSWGFRGDLSSLVGFVMLAVFMLTITCLDMVFLTVSAYRMCFAECSAAGPRTSGLSWSRTCSKLCMLDVCLAGIVAVVISLWSLQERGLVTRWGGGFALLGGAEFIHYALHHITALVAPCKAQHPIAEGACTEKACAADAAA